METSKMSAIDKKLVIALVAWVSVLMLVANAADVVANPESGIVTSRDKDMNLYDSTESFTDW